MTPNLCPILALLALALAAEFAACNSNNNNNIADREFGRQSDQLDYYYPKRSLCNTFGGCGSKRSVVERAEPSSFSLSSPELEPHLSTHLSAHRAPSAALASAGLSKKQETRARLVAEVLTDLADYLQTSEGYRQGNYLVMVPRPFDAAGEPELQDSPLGRLLLATTNELRV